MKIAACFFAILIFFCMGINLHGKDVWDYSRQCTAAWQSGDYDTAITAKKNMIAVSNNDSLWPDVNRAGDHVSLAMLEWSAGNKDEAKAAMLRAIHIMRTGEYMANTGCEQRAELFYQKMCREQLPSKFYYRDTYTYGIHGYIMEVPRALFNKKVAALKARYEALGHYFGSMTRTYRMQGETQARMAKHYARSEYQRVTQSSFSPNDPPSSGTEARKVWDACKRVYDIFE